MVIAVVVGLLTLANCQYLSITVIPVWLSYCVIMCCCGVCWGGGGRVEGFSMLPGIMCRVKLEATGFGLYLNVQVLLEAAFKHRQKA